MIANRIVLNGELSSAGTSDAVALFGRYALSIGDGSSWSGSVNVERSFDDGATWRNIKTYTGDAEETIFADGHQIKYRINCTALASGSVKYMVVR